MSLDHSIFFFLNSFAGQAAWSDALIIFFATYVPFFVVACFALYLLNSKRMLRHEMMLAFFSALLASLIARIGITSPIRYFFPHPRPFVSLDVHDLFVVQSSSFPSGHAAFFFAFSTVVFFYNRKLGVVFFGVSTLICTARVAAGVHFPSDILGGLVVGVFSGLLTHYFIAPLFSRVYRDHSEYSTYTGKMKSNLLIAGTIIGILLVSGFFVLNDYIYKQKQGPNPTPPQAQAADLRNQTYVINGASVTLIDGHSVVEAAPGSASKIETEYFGNEAVGDVNADGKDDVAFLITQSTGGTGLFYYAVVALKTDTGYTPTNAFLIGDRIAPQSTEITSGEIHVNFAERNPGEPMTTPPSAGAVLLLKVTPQGVLEGLMK